MQDSCLRYVRDVLGVSEFVSTAEPQRPFHLSDVPLAPGLVFVVPSTLTPEGQELLSKIAAALGFPNYDLKAKLAATGAVPTRTVAFGEHFGAEAESHSLDVLVAPAIEELLGSDPAVVQKKRALWTKMKSWR